MWGSFSWQSCLFIHSYVCLFKTFSGNALLQLVWRTFTDLIFTVKRIETNAVSKGRSEELKRWIIMNHLLHNFIIFLCDMSTHEWLKIIHNSVECVAGMRMRKYGKICYVRKWWGSMSVLDRWELFRNKITFFIIIFCLWLASWLFLDLQFFISWLRGVSSQGRVPGQHPLRLTI